ncbi:L-fucose mutarotase [Defluviimonas aquaemixtae]|uniref:L-fucose mutarotase n=1 Tax=Albidovulum aquaemixtae TaxID=1542388 RepID=A0A2R8B2H1_9RHOB|nr:RbsD/FucU domain-containing protein [Defluviimonas aquaemixtae]SPH16834.1 L-fucose mutarotase [Defluviimonas aquaemixtae]
MLRGIDPILSPDLLHALAAMGHGDEIVIADANFPGTSMGRLLIRADGVTASAMLRAVLSLMPLDTFVDDPAVTMQVVGDPDAVPEAVRDFQAIVNEVADAPATLAGIERHAFYDRAKAAFAVIQTGETRLYGNIILKKGVIGP